MTVFILDSSAVLRYIDDEAGADRIGEIFIGCVQGQCDMRISALQWGEIAGRLRKRLGPRAGMRVLDSLMPNELEIIPATAERAVRASTLRLERKIHYVDGFALDLAMDSPEHILVTADYDFKAVADLARIEFLPPK